MQKDIPPERSIVGLSASELAEGIRVGELSVSEVVGAHIERIDAVNPQINAVVVPLFDEARVQASAADDALRRGDDVGPLHGVPVTIKEQYRVAGTQTTLGATKQVGNIYDDEGPLVTKLRRAGAIIVGKTNIIQTLAGWESDNPVYGRSSNPWNLDRTPGGSSGGEAAIVAAGGSALGLAGDFGGSTRVPAHFCGVHGYKPTSSRLSNDDFATGLLRNGQEVFIPQPGPIARTVADLQLAMALFAETSMHPTGDVVPPVPWPDPTRIDIAGLRIGMYTDNDYFTVSPAVQRAVHESADALRALGAVVEPIVPPDAREGVRLFLRTVSAGGGSDYIDLLGGEKPIPQVAGMLRGLGMPSFMRPIVSNLMALRGQGYVSEMVSNLQRSSTEEYLGIVEARNAYRAAFTKTLDEGGFSAVICPPFALPALTHGSSEHLFAAASYAFVYNVLGAPAGVVSTTTVGPDEEGGREAGRDLADMTAKQVEQGSTGLPVGVQVVARHWDDDIVLAVMAALEQESRNTPNYPNPADLTV